MNVNLMSLLMPNDALDVEMVGGTELEQGSDVDGILSKFKVEMSALDSTVDESAELSTFNNLEVNTLSSGQEIDKEPEVVSSSKEPIGVSKTAIDDFIEQVMFSKSGTGVTSSVPIDSSEPKNLQVTTEVSTSTDDNAFEGAEHRQLLIGGVEEAKSFLSEKVVRGVGYTDSSTEQNAKTSVVGASSNTKANPSSKVPIAQSVESQNVSKILVEGADAGKITLTSVTELESTFQSASKEVGISDSIGGSVRKKGLQHEVTKPAVLGTLSPAKDVSLSNAERSAVNLNKQDLSSGKVFDVVPSVSSERVKTVSKSSEVSQNAKASIGVSHPLQISNNIEAIADPQFDIQQDIEVGTSNKLSKAGVIPQEKVEAKLAEMGLVVRQSALNKIKNITVHLKPIELGSVDVTIEDLNGELNIKMVAEKLETVESLQKNEVDMRQSLNHSAASFSFSQQNRPGKQFSLNGSEVSNEHQESGVLSSSLGNSAESEVHSKLSITV